MSSRLPGFTNVPVHTITETIFLTANEAARTLGVHVETIRRWVRDGLIEHSRRGHVIEIPLWAVEAARLDEVSTRRRRLCDGSLRAPEAPSPEQLDAYFAGFAESLGGGA